MYQSLMNAVIVGENVKDEIHKRGKKRLNYASLQVISLSKLGQSYYPKRSVYTKTNIRANTALRCFKDNKAFNSLTLPDTTAFVSKAMQLFSLYETTILYDSFSGEAIKVSSGP